MRGVLCFAQAAQSRITSLVELERSVSINSPVTSVQFLLYQQMLFIGSIRTLLFHGNDRGYYKMACISSYYSFHSLILIKKRSNVHRFGRSNCAPVTQKGNQAK